MLCSQEVLGAGGGSGKGSRRSRRSSPAGRRDKGTGTSKLALWIPVTMPASAAIFPSPSSLSTRACCNVAQTAASAAQTAAHCEPASSGESAASRRSCITKLLTPGRGVARAPTCTSGMGAAECPAARKVSTQPTRPTSETGASATGVQLSPSSPDVQAATTIMPRSLVRPIWMMWACGRPHVPSSFVATSPIGFACGALQAPRTVSLGPKA